MKNLYRLGWKEVLRLRKELNNMKNANEVVASDLAGIVNNLKPEFSAMAGKRLLVVGGAGFLGYYLVQSIVAWNRQADARSAIALTVFDNYSRGIPGWLEQLHAEPGLSLQRHDITDPLPQDMGHFDFIIHAASIASPTYYRKFPIETMDANVNGLRRLLDYCIAEQAQGHGVEGFLYYSTSEIYGDPPPENIPTAETYRGNVSCTGPRACYDESKRYGETLCVNFAQQYNLPIKIARPFNNYGPGLKISDRRVLPDFARDVLAGRDIVMLSDGSPSRTFCYIADAICGYYKILVKGRPGESYNIGVAEPEVSMLDLAKLITDQAGELFGYGGRIVESVSEDADYLVDNPNRRCPDITKAQRELGYAPGMALAEGMTRSLIWYQSNQEAANS